MPASPYKSVSWVEEPITTNKLNQMTSNDQYLFEHQPRIRYVTGGVTKESGLKMLSGIVTIPSNPTASGRSVNVSFGNFFTPNIFPNVTVSLACQAQRQLQVSMCGLNYQARPTSQGMNLYVWHPTQKLTATSYVYYLAIGI